MRKCDRNWLALAVVACAGGIGSVTNAAPRVVNIAGATLLENFVSSFASTNDYIDVDGDGIVTGGGISDQLAPSGSLAVGYPGAWWVVQYRLSGSVEGLAELVAFGATNCNPGVIAGQTDYVTTPGGSVLEIATQSKAYATRTLYINGGATTGPANPGNPGASPVTTEADDTYFARPFSTSPMGGGVQIDVTPMDVPPVWAVKGAVGDIHATNTPASVGYGRNPRLAVKADGTAATGVVSNQLVDLGARRLASQTTPPYPDDSNTIFDKPLAWVPIAPITNLGVAKSQLQMSSLRHLFVSGRLPTGENLTACTRDVGSGTRNGFSNTTGTDPSMGVGENVGARHTNSDSLNVGRTYLPSNIGGSGQMETTVQNTRLAIGYTGAERGVNSPSWLTGGRLEIIAVQNDLYPGVNPATAPYNRPNENTTVDNEPVNGWVIGGPATLNTIGDAYAESVADGGFANGNPAMCNKAAADYINNIFRSIEAFNAVPGGGDTFFTPAERLAQQFLLVPSVDFLPATFNPTTQVVNTVVPALQTWERTNAVYTNGAYDNFGTATLNGQVPTRNGLTGTDKYSDDVALGANYKTQGVAGTRTGTGADNLSAGGAIRSRNRVAGDFNGDGLRNVNDASEMLKAWRFQNGMDPSWIAPAGSGPIAGAPGSDACIELLGDFNNDGDFGRHWINGSLAYFQDRSDVRYWADGLAIDPGTGKLNRQMGFQAIDNNWNTLTGGASNNFFGTTKVLGTYQPGEARADVAGSLGRNTLTTPGYNPIGANGVIDANDIDYVRAQFNGYRSCVTDGVCNWGADVNEASCTDLSCDINGDLIIEEGDTLLVRGGAPTGDVDTLVITILGTNYGDVNLDGVVNSTDETIVQNNQGQPGGWAMGDINGDFMVDAADLAFFNPPVCPGDVTGDNAVGLADIAPIVQCWAQPAACNPAADLDGNGSIGLGDIAQVVSHWGQTCP